MSTDLNHSRLEALFRGVSIAAGNQQIHEALKLADCARRLAPDDAVTLSIYARLLLRVEDFAEANRLLGLRREPELVALRALALSSLGFYKEAGTLCETLLSQRAADSIEELAELAASCAFRSPGSEFGGWVGVNECLKLVGEIRAGDALHVQIAAVAISATFHETDRFTPDNRPVLAFAAEVPAGLVGHLSVFAAGRPLLGYGMPWPPEFAANGWVLRDNGRLIGRASMAWAPEQPVVLAIGRAGAPAREHLVAGLGAGAAGTSFAIPLFSIPLDDAESACTTLDVSLVLPDKSHFALVGSPARDIHEQVQFRQSLQRCPSGQRQGGDLLAEAKVDIVIAVYNGLEETRRCIESVLAATPRDQAELVVVDDASSDQELRVFLARLAGEGRITLLSNPINLGFPGSANVGMRLHNGRDVVLLNSDAEVFGDWLPRLRSAAYASAGNGTVTPLGEHASIMTYAADASGNCSREQARQIDALAREVNAGHTVDVPVGVGFCLYIKRACLAETGGFDETTFDKGYGEENDFCLRASAVGWRHVAATDIFVRHRGATSFSTGKAMLTERNGLILARLYPHYDDMVAGFIAADPLMYARRAIDMRRLRATRSHPVLLVTSVLAGGVKRHVDMRSAKWKAEGQPVVVLRPSAKDGHVDLTLPEGGSQQLCFKLPEELPVLHGLLTDLSPQSIEVHHFVGLSSALLELVTDLKRPYDVYLHDYSWICPRLTLADGSGSYCVEPPVEVCEQCIAKNGSFLGEAISVASLRERSGWILLGANAVFAPSHDVRLRFGRYFPQLLVQVTLWQAAPPFPELPLRPHRQGSLRVVVIGGISVPKGCQVLLDCARDAAARDLNLDFTVIGFSSEDNALLATGRVFLTGPYNDDEVGALLVRARADIALFPSVVPETWCYALTHALTAGLPIVAFDLGAIAERLRNYRAATLLPLFSPSSSVNEALLALAQNSTTPRIRKVPDMEPEVATTSPTGDGMTTSVQFLPLPEGLYTFTVTGGAPSTGNSEELVFPAVQIGVAPSKSEATVEFLARGGTADRWLARSRDMLIARISEPGASLMLTSMRSADSPALGINIRRVAVDLFSTDPEFADEASTETPGTLPAKIVAHIHRVGDVPFSDGWAGCLGDRFWIEAFAIGSIGELTPDMVEYCGVTADGYQTPWLGNQMLCGSRGRAVPMLGCAIRLKPEAAEKYDCVYTCQFVSGKTLGPFRNGDLCCSDLPRDPLWGLELSAVERVDTGERPAMEVVAAAQQRIAEGTPVPDAP